MNVEENSTKQQPDEHPKTAEVTQQDQDYQHRKIPPVGQRVRHWHHVRNGGLLCSAAGVSMLLAGHFAGSGRAMQIGVFFILAGAVVFTVGVIGGWVTRERPLD